jgi:tetratricopeptide (TPR) repeat protein
MKEPIQDIELIERYFDNALSTEEVNDLRGRMKHDFELQKLFDREKLLINTIRADAASRDLEYLKSLEASLSDSARRDKRRVWYYYAAAACAAVLALALWMTSGDREPQQLYASYFQPHPNIFEPVLRGTSDGSIRSQAFQAYEQGDYQRAASLFNEITKRNNEPGTLMLLGNANLMIGNTAEAKENFLALINQFDDLDVAGKWYLGLCYVRTGEVQAAVDLLKEIQNAESPYAVKARKLLNELE